jgi:hypothetical protein
LKLIGWTGPQRSRGFLFACVAVLALAWHVAPAALAAPPADAATKSQQAAQATPRPGPGKSAVSSAYPLATEARAETRSTLLSP